MKLSEFDYYLPKELIAQYPLPRRDSSRLLVLHRDKGKIYHRRFSNILDYLNKGDCIVLNDTRVIPARLIGRSETGGRAEVFILEKLGRNRYKTLLKPSSRLKDKKIYFNNNGIEAKVIKAENPESMIEFNQDVDLSRIGRVPLPPYIKREPKKIDEARYQTVYAKNEGATAAPTAGLHFTDEILEKIRNSGVEIAYITLHVSYGTFAPVLEEDIENHKMYREYFQLPAETIEKIKETKTNKRKILAVGTTTTRVLESNPSKLTAIKGWTDLFIYPGYKCKVINSLLTNFHLPKTTLLMLVSAFCGKEILFRAYKEAIEEKYRFYSYGDAMLII